MRGGAIRGICTPNGGLAESAVLLFEETHGQFGAEVGPEAHCAALVEASALDLIDLQRATEVLKIEDGKEVDIRGAVPGGRQ